MIRLTKSEMILKNHTQDKNGIFVPDSGAKYDNFGKEYHELRLAEKRIYTNEELAELPIFLRITFITKNGK